MNNTDCPDCVGIPPSDGSPCSGCGKPEPAIDLIAVATLVLGGRLDMAVKTRATWLAASDGWSWEDERVEDLTRYEDEISTWP